MQRHHTYEVVRLCIPSIAPSESFSGQEVIFFRAKGATEGQMAWAHELIFETRRPQRVGTYRNPLQYALYSIRLVYLFRTPENICVTKIDVV